MNKAEPTHGDEDMQEEYDFSGGERGKYAARFGEGTNVVLLDPDVAEHFRSSEQANRWPSAVLGVAAPVSAAAVAGPGPGVATGSAPACVGRLGHGGSPPHRRRGFTGIGRLAAPERPCERPADGGS